MASVFDILGTVFGVLSLLGCFKSLYSFLKRRQPFAQAGIFEGALRETYQRIDELERFGYLSENPNLAFFYRSALARIDRESLRARAQAERHRSKSVIAVLVYSCRYGTKCPLSRQIAALTKLVRDIRHQLDYPLENPYINYSGLVPNKHKYIIEEGKVHSLWRPGISDEVKSAVTGTQLYRSTEGLKYRNISWASDPPVDADIASQLFAIRAHRMQRIQARLDIIAQSILRRSEVVRDFPSNIIRLNRLLMIERGMLPPEDSLVDVKESDSTATKEPGKSAALDFKTYEETKVAEHKAASREMDELKKQFQCLLDFEFADTKMQSAHIAVKTRQTPLGIGASRRTTDDTPTAVMASGVSATSVTRSHQD